MKHPIISYAVLCTVAVLAVSIFLDRENKFRANQQRQSARQIEKAIVGTNSWLVWNEPATNVTVLTNQVRKGLFRLDPKAPEYPDEPLTNTVYCCTTLYPTGYAPVTFSYVWKASGEAPTGYGPTGFCHIYKTPGGNYVVHHDSKFNTGSVFVDDFKTPEDLIDILSRVNGMSAAQMIAVSNACLIDWRVEKAWRKDVP